MGLPEEYKLPNVYNEAYHLLGDGVVVPVVQHLARHILEPIILPKGNSAVLELKSSEIRRRLAV
jgi:DNA (cytosine-5)-methyltransferase 1